MKTTLLTAFSFAFGFLFLTSCDMGHCNPEPTPNSISSQVEANSNLKPSAQYTCMMHPMVKSDHPGNCPKCGMALKKQ